MSSQANVQTQLMAKPAFTPVASGVLQRTCGCGQHTAGNGGECEECKKKRNGLLQRAAKNPSPVNEVPPIVQDVLRSPGQPLDAQTRAFMEPRFGHDFSHVRVHLDAKAKQSAGVVDALAYTLGRDIVFGVGQYMPSTKQGQKLIAHELTHVVQQLSSPETLIQQLNTLEVADAQNAHESEANTIADYIVNDDQGILPDLAFPRAVESSPHSMLQRQPARRSRATARSITQVDVNQTLPQRVTITWSDGTSESDECSTGKGHCCFDESLGQGGVCSEAGSRVGGSNCTAIGTFHVTAKIPETPGGVELWTQFVDGRSIALHDYDPLVDGTPLSHGCVRLHRSMAQKIYDGAVIGRTRVIVRNLAQPRCNHSALQREWLGDFRTAGKTPPDGEPIDPVTGQRRSRAELSERARERRNIRRERRDLQSALGVDEAGLDHVISELQAPTSGLSDVTTPAAQEALLERIPRCMPRQTTEEARIPAATSAGVASRPGASRLFQRALNSSTGRRGGRAIVRRFGQAMWEGAVRRAQASVPDTNDRLLYWSRLQMTEAIRQFSASWINRLNPDQSRRARQELLDIFEQTSRGMQDIDFRSDEQTTKRILISGFDPFGLGSGSGGDIRRSNPSGATALALDGKLLTVGGVDGRVEAVIFPVRYADFDLGIVENLFRPFLTGENPVDLIMTISMGISSDFELERFAGRRRSSTATENVGARGNQPTTSGSATIPPPEIRGVSPGPEFLRTNMLRDQNGRVIRTPALEAMQRRLGRNAPLEAEVAVEEIRPGTTSVTTSRSGPTSGSTAFSGSGGGFLSNEIFYRTSLLRSQTGATTQVIHLHTPLLFPDAPASERDRIVQTARTLLEAALPQL